MPDPGLEAAQSTSSEGGGRLNMAYLLLLERRHPSCETDTVETDSAKIPSTGTKQNIYSISSRDEEKMESAKRTWFPVVPSMDE